VGRPAAEHPEYAEALKRIDALPPERWFSPWWLRTYQDVNAVLAGCWMDAQAGGRVCGFFERCLRHSKTGVGENEPAGRPVVLMDWVKWDILYPLFGWRRPDGTRRFRKASVWIPKKNSKSFTCSGLGLYLLTKDQEPNAEVYSAAGSRDQASIIWKESARMVRRAASAKLRRLLTLVDSRKAITYQTLTDEGSFKALASEAGLQEGLNWSALLFDEVHVQADREFYDTLVYGGIARRQPLLIQISTAGQYDPMSIGWEEYSDAVRIHEGGVNNWETLVYIAKVAVADDWFAERPGEADDDWTDPAVLKKANPGVGITFKEEDLLAQRDEALETPRKQNRFLRYRGNIWTNAATRWMDVRTWAACACRDPEYVAALEGQPCWGGMDLSLGNDLTAVVLWFKPGRHGAKHRVLPFFWLPQDNIAELEKQSRAPYRQWARRGLMELTPGNWIDFGTIRQRVNELAERFRIQQMGYDPWQAREIVQGLMSDGLKMEEVRQTAAVMCGPTANVEAKVRRLELEHPDHEILNWHVGNCQPLYDTKGNYYLTKGERRGASKGAIRYKIDGANAMITANALACVSEDKRSVYETRGLLKL
jgi:phage terminase large subunit-like protein